MKGPGNAPAPSAAMPPRSRSAVSVSRQDALSEAAAAATAAAGTRGSGRQRSAMRRSTAARLGTCYRQRSVPVAK